ncbi:aminotransferase class I/II-fold pyridoxal phosphate-dependent enzyme [Aeromicrobium sp. 636]|uniref:cysteine-S-conjugate beta-lyase n=1 Tax=Aeromicrobium senzhongii TaxID=2663859 RepID=A0A8I0EX30_9ACTN|nr:aminotransferase class I/II-fold pyridoxal phosphate-dependent enzyme [Aeromicrobium sp. 636]MBC9226877.1 aminotransferase class I/II-fold pyridoxal phosphate-dependent enzyme [Aeromicrobium senzhongii]MCQ3998977.1 aminotransferase class I/II-fold pyridoxal phosphate-dependent enzyme [Aeromicrobium sp. 636]
MFDLTDDALRDRDNMKWTTTPSGVIPAWVADMDVEVPEVVTRAVHDRLARGDVGYPDFDAPDPLVGAFERRMADRFDWTPAPGRGRLFTDVIQAFQVMLDLLTQAGEGIALHVPSYPVFLNSIAESGRRVVPLPFGATSDELVEQWRREQVSLVVVVNPHNPLGRMLGEDELRPIADAAAALDLVVLADEIHADLALDGRRHVPFASLGRDVEDRTVTVTSASKAFNLAGLHCAVAHLGAARVREPLAALPFAYLGGVSTLSRAAAVAAWTEGDAWLTELLGVLRRNRFTITDWAAQVGVDVQPAEATYLAWLDFAGTPIAADPAGLLLERGGVRLAPGPEFTAHTDLESGTFARLNFGTSPERLERILERITATLV